MFHLIDCLIDCKPSKTFISKPPQEMASSPRLSTPKLINDPPPLAQQKRRSTGAFSKTSMKAERETQQQQVEQQQRERQIRIVASTFANMELLMTQQTYEATAKQHSEAAAEVDRLKAELEARDRDALEVADFLRKDATAKATKLKDLEIQLVSFETKKMQDENAIRRNYESIIKSKDATISAAEQQIDRLSKEVDAAAKYQIEKSDLLLELDEARAKQKSLVEHYEQELNRVKFASVEERVRLQAVEAEMSKTFKQEVELRSTAIAKMKNAQVHGLNEQLLKDREILEQEVDALVKMANGYRAEIEELKRERNVSSDLHHNTLKQTLQLKLKAHDADSQKRLAEVEKVGALAAAGQEHDRERSYLQQQISLLQGELANTKSQHSAQAGELRRVKALSSTILQRRSGLEQFFYAAIDEVRKRRVPKDATFLTGVPPSSSLTLTTPRQAQSPVSASVKLETFLRMGPSSARMRLLTGDRSARYEVIGEGEGAGIGGSSRESKRATSARGTAAERTIDPDAYYHNHVADAKMVGRALQRAGNEQQREAGDPTIEATTRPAPTESVLPDADTYAQLPATEKEQIIKAMLRYMNAFMFIESEGLLPTQSQSAEDPTIEAIASAMLEGAAEEQITETGNPDLSARNRSARPATTKAPHRNLTSHSFAPRPPSSGLLPSRPPTRALPLAITGTPSGSLPPMVSPRK